MVAACRALLSHAQLVDAERDVGEGGLQGAHGRTVVEALVPGAVRRRRGTGLEQGAGFRRYLERDGVYVDALLLDVGAQLRRLCIQDNARLRSVGIAEVAFGGKAEG